MNLPFSVSYVLTVTVTQEWTVYHLFLKLHALTLTRAMPRSLPAARVRLVSAALATMDPANHQAPTYL